MRAAPLRASCTPLIRASHGASPAGATRPRDPGSSLARASSAKLAVIHPRAGRSSNGNRTSREVYDRPYLTCSCRRFSRR